MSGPSKPFRRACVRCGDLFAAPRSKGARCCPGCFEELEEARQDLQHSMARYRSLREKVESLQEALRRHKVNKRSRIAERKKFELEEKLLNLKRIVGDDTSIDDPF